MKKDSAILDMAAELAADLHRVGAMDKATLRQIERLAVPEVAPLSPEDIRAIRESARVSQPVFARYLNVTASTVAQWEQGAKRPGGASLRLLDVVRRKGLAVIG